MYLCGLHFTLTLVLLLYLGLTLTERFILLLTVSISRLNYSDFCNREVPLHFSDSEIVSESFDHSNETSLKYFIRYILQNLELKSKIWFLQVYFNLFPLGSFLFLIPQCATLVSMLCYISISSESLPSITV